jgi:hypothetical protein
MRMLKALTERSEETGVAHVLETSARVFASAVIVFVGWAERVRSRLGRGPTAAGHLQGGGARTASPWDRSGP